MKKLAAIVAGIVLSGVVWGECVCTCVNGTPQPLCSNALDMEPICSPRICPIDAPSIRPIESLSLPPLGTKACRNKRVLNPRTNQYEWKRVCIRDE